VCGILESSLLEAKQAEAIQCGEMAWFRPEYGLIKLFSLPEPALLVKHDCSLKRL